jgi:hypothetical protein
MDREDVNLIGSDEPVDDTVRRMNYLANQWIVEFRNGPTGLRKRHQPIGCGDELGNDDRRVLRRILADERANGCKVRTGLLGPEENPHDKNCFLTSSWDTS